MGLDRRLIQSFAEVVDACPCEPFDALLANALAQSHCSRPQELDSRALAGLARDYLALYRKLVGRNFPQDPIEQLKAAVSGVHRSWNGARAREYRRLNNIPNDLGTAVTVQRMVFGNAGGTSGSGVAFTRNPASGENRLYMDFMFNAQGEDVVSGRHPVSDDAQLASILPVIARQLSDAARTLEAEFRDMQEFEFTVQDEVLYLLQTRTGKRTALAEVRIAVDQVREGMVEPAEAAARVGRVDTALLRNVKAIETTASPVICTATSASSGVATGAIVLDLDSARSKGTTEPVILVRQETDTSDIAALANAGGLLTARGGRTSHAAVVARQMDKVALVGCTALTIDMPTRTCTVSGTRLSEGDTITLDGTTGRIFGNAGGRLRIYGYRGRRDRELAQARRSERPRKVARGLNPSHRISRARLSPITRRPVRAASRASKRRQAKRTPFDPSRHALSTARLRAMCRRALKQRRPRRE